jgi:tubulin polyglutamylase TTLL6/13
LKKEESNRHAGVDIIWHDVMIMHDKFASIKSHQRVNHFPSMSGVTKKNQLATSLKKMKNLYPVDFGFFPKTWIVPA